jgi:hypothetical protein
MTSTYKPVWQRPHRWHSAAAFHPYFSDDEDHPTPPSPAAADPDLECACQTAFLEMRSPYSLLLLESHCPRFSCGFLRQFAVYFDSEGPDFDRIFEYLIPSNAGGLVEVGLLNRLIRGLPSTFSPLCELVEEGGVVAAREFVFSSGLWSLVQFAEVREYSVFVASLFRGVCVAEWDYFEPILPPISFEDLLNGADFPEVYTRDLLNMLYQSPDGEVVEPLLQGLGMLFERDKRACVAFGDWYLEKLSELVARPGIGLLSVEVASLALKHAQLARPEPLIGMIESLLGETEDDLVCVGLVLSATVAERWQVTALDDSAVVETAMRLANEGSFRVKAHALRALSAFLQACEFAKFKEFVSRGIMDLVFAFFNTDGGVMAADHDMVGYLLKMMVVILERFVFTEPDTENLKQMGPMYEILRGLADDSNRKIARKAQSVLAGLSPYWIEYIIGDG